MDFLDIFTSKRQIQSMFKQKLSTQIFYIFEKTWVQKKKTELKKKLIYITLQKTQVW